jgi:predicted metal-dependent hydrolase
MDAYLEGIRLFNDGEFWHAHEQWEACWLVAAEPEATFYQGIIQAAAALVHWKKGNLRGLQRNWAKGRPKLVALPPAMQGLDLHALIAAMDRFVIAGGSPAPVPRIQLIAAPVGSKSS